MAKAGTLLPQLPEVDFEGDLSKAKETAWYAEVTKDSDSSRDTVAVYGEKDGFALFLALSRLCLDAASSASGTAEDDLIKLAVSVMMPIVSIRRCRVLSIRSCEPFFSPFSLVGVLLG